MSPRELIILVLGFAMVGVLLRGLFVAIQVRRVTRKKKVFKLRKR